MHPRLNTARSMLHRAVQLRARERAPAPDAGPAPIADALPEACWLYAPESGQFTYVNPAFVRRWGGCAEAPGACLERWLDRVVADDRDAVQAALQGLAQGRSYAIEYRALDRCGATLWIAEDARFAATAPGAPRLVVGLSRDISAHRRAQQALQDALQRKDEFLAVLMHELRTPLQAIRAAGAVLPRADASSARIIERQVRHLARLVDDLGEATRITHGKVHLQLETVDLRAVVQCALDDVHAGVEARPLQLRLLAPDTPVWVRADPARLAQVFNNLLHNAVKFSVAGGRVEVRIGGAPGSDEATVSVRDEGVGIAAEAVDSVFDLFTQQADAPTHGRDGLGIGLSVVRGLVELHGGRVTVHSDGRGTGSRFDVTLATVPAPGAARPLRILVVEDNADAAAGLQLLLQLDGHAVAVAADGRSGLRQAAHWRPDTVIVDLDLPDLDGREVARRIRHAGPGPGPRLIALSGSGDVDWQAMHDAGFDDCLAKPACPSYLAAAIGGGQVRTTTCV